jgi:outer membrane protein OmpA-like peptidoglycan-associated protein
MVSIAPRWCVCAAAISVLVFPSLTQGVAVAQSEAGPSLVSFSSGALVVQKPEEWDPSWASFWMFDERPSTGWASPEGAVTNQVVVVEMAERSVLKKGRGARNILVEVSDASAQAGFRAIAEVSLVDQADNQSFPVTAEVPGRWVRFTIRNNHGASDYMEVMDIRAYGTQLTTTLLPNVSGTYATDYDAFHIRQEGNSITGCYGQEQGVLSGGIEGRIMKLNWREEDRQGPAIMAFTADGNIFFGLWWEEGSESGAGGIWDGTKQSTTVGSCPHWSGGVQAQMAEDLSESGRTRVYGINFDVDSDRIRDESKPTLDLIVALLTDEPDLSLTVEGHTDATGTDEHNMDLSRRRAEAVRSYLVNAGISADRLDAVGLGATKPVAPNDTPIGRAQNRRVELVRR